MAALLPAPQSDDETLLRAENWNDVNEGRVTYSNRASARRDGAAIEVKAIIRIYKDGVRSDRAPFNSLAAVPIGVVGCDGNPRILTWVTAVAWSETSYRLEIPGPVSRAGVDPWGELLDNGKENMVPVEGEAACPER